MMKDGRYRKVFMLEGKKEIAKRGYMKGHYVVGSGHAHKCCSPHTKVFGREMIGTFNVKLRAGRVDDFEPLIITKKSSYWFVKISRDNRSWYGWAVRDHSSKQTFRTLEILTETRLPGGLKKGSLKINIYESLGENQKKMWGIKHREKTDEDFVWNVINVIDWKGLSVLDIDSYKGFFATKIVDAGAKRSACVESDMKFDVILYIGVHHKIDPSYEYLRDKIEELKGKAIKHLFVELVMPPAYPKDGNVGESVLDDMIGGRILMRYRYNICEIRKIYWVRK